MRINVTSRINAPDHGPNSAELTQGLDMSAAPTRRNLDIIYSVIDAMYMPSGMQTASIKMK